MIDSPSSDVKDRQYVRNAFLLEIEILQKLKHDNISIGSINSVADHQSPGMVLELASHNNMVSYIYSKGGRLAEDETRALARRVMSTFANLHDIVVLHRDIKPANILMFGQKPLLFKLADFGSSYIAPIANTP